MLGKDKENYVKPLISWYKTFNLYYLNIRTCNYVTIPTVIKYTFFNWFRPMFHNYSAANSAVHHWAKPIIKHHHRLAVLQNRLDNSSSMVSVNSALCISIGISILFGQWEFGLDHSSTMPGTLTNLSEQMSNCFADVLFYLHNVELLLNEEFKPDVDNLFCRSANRSARTTRMGSEFCSCVETVLAIGRFQMKKGVVGTQYNLHVRTR